MIRYVPPILSLDQARRWANFPETPEQAGGLAGDCYRQAEAYARQASALIREQNALSVERSQHQAVLDRARPGADCDWSAVAASREAVQSMDATLREHGAQIGRLDDAAANARSRLARAWSDAARIRRMLDRTEPVGQGEHGDPLSEEFLLSELARLVGWRPPER